MKPFRLVNLADTTKTLWDLTTHFGCCLVVHPILIAGERDLCDTAKQGSVVILRPGAGGDRLMPVAK